MYAPTRLAALVLRLAAVTVAVVLAAAGLLSSTGPAAAAPPGRDQSPAEVDVGVYVNNIQAVNVSTNSFEADFYLWLRWTDPDINPPKGVEVMNVYEKWALMVAPVHDQPQRQDDGSLLWLARYQGSFNAPLSLADYPFEKQRLKIIIEDGVENTKRVVYRTDTDPIKLDHEVTLPGYNFGQPRITVGDHTYDSSFGSRESTPADQTFPRVVVEIPLSSPAVSGIVKTILPIIIVMVASALGLIIPTSYVDSKVNVPIFSLLALVAMHWGVSSMLPEVNYLVMIDVLYIVAYAAATAMLAISVASAWRLRSQDEAAATRSDRRALVAISTAYLLATAAVFIVYLL